MTCDRQIGPYPCCSVVEGNCLELMRALPDGCVDAVITDPPYGIGYCHGARKGGFRMGTDCVSIHGDNEPFDPSPWLRFPKIILWGANYYSSRLPDSSRWLVWDKRDGIPSNDQADGEMAWTNLGGVLRLKTRYWNGAQARERDEPRVHSNQKPLSLMEWCIEQAGNPETILDPFCGSGTTLVAAKKLGRHFLGFELNENYCQISRERLAAVDAQPSLFEPKPEQMSL
jgi:site-specific DNA-methyltransferase (adenine-specific)